MRALLIAGYAAIIGLKYFGYIPVSWWTAIIQWLLFLNARYRGKIMFCIPLGYVVGAFPVESGNVY